MDYLLNLYSKFTNDDGTNFPRKIVTFGNVLLDTTVNIDDTKILDRYNLSLETKGEISAETLAQISDEVSGRLSSPSHPGGSALNTTRILKQLGTEGLFCGAIGRDKHAEELKSILGERVISTRLQTVEGYPTGQCICFVHKDKTALYANIGASAKFSIDYLKELECDEENNFLRPPERKQIIYIEGFFVPQRADVCRYIVQKYINGRRMLAFNLNATYIIEENFDEILYLVNHSFLVFGNFREFSTLCTKMGHVCVEAMAKSLISPSDVKIFIVTKGSQNVELITNCTGEQTAGPVCFETFNVPKVDEIIDTTGAGDSFVAGFLHAFLEKRPISECVRAASSVACKVVTQIGCNLPL